MRKVCEDRSFSDFVDVCMGGCGMNIDLQYAFVFGPAAGFQSRHLLPVTNGLWWMRDGGGWWMGDGGFQKGSLNLLNFFSDEVHNT